MSDQPRPGAHHSKTRLLAIAVIAFGLAIAAFFGVRSMRSFREIQYIRQEGLDRGTASVDAIRPWMSIRYIANSTGVPESEIFATVGLPAAGNEDKPLDLLSQEQRYPGGPRALVEAVQNALRQRKATP